MFYKIEFKDNSTAHYKLAVLKSLAETNYKYTVTAELTKSVVTIDRDNKVATYTFVGI